MNTRTALLFLLSLPVLLLWAHTSLVISSTVNGLIRVLVGFMIVTLMWGVEKYWGIGYITSAVSIFLVAGILAQFGIGILIESFMLMLPFISVIMTFYYRSVMLILLTPTAIYIYALLSSYATTIGLSYKAALAPPSIVASIGRLVLAGRVPVTVSYEPIPGLTVLYAISIISLILLIIDMESIREAGIPALDDASRILVLALLLSLVLVYVVLIVTGVYVVMWSITVTAIFIISFLAYRLLVRDNR